MDITLLVNPAARSGAAAHIGARAQRLLRERGVRTTVVSGTSAAESAALVRAAVDGGASGIAVCGGDGTVALAVGALAGTGIPLGIVPAGTGNDIAAALGLPGHDLAAAADVIAAGRTRAIDLARARGEDSSETLFATVLASGFDSRVNDRANAMRWPRGGSRYTLAILREFVTLRAIPYEIELTDAGGARRTIAEDLIMATVANGPTYGGGIRISPDSDIEDGLIEVVLVRPVSRMRLLRLLPRVYAGTHTTIPEVSVHRVRAVRLNAPAVTGYADGDAVGRLPLTVDAMPGALRVFAR